MDAVGHWFDGSPDIQITIDNNTAIKVSSRVLNLQGKRLVVHPVCSPTGSGKLDGVSIFFEAPNKSHKRRDREAIVLGQSKRACNATPNDSYASDGLSEESKHSEATEPFVEESSITRKPKDDEEEEEKEEGEEKGDDEEEEKGQDNEEPAKTGGEAD